LKLLLHGAGKKGNPALEMGRLQPVQVIQVDMRLHGVAHIASGAQQQPAPEVIELGAMRYPVNVGNVFKKRSQQFVLPHIAIKGVDKSNDVVLGGDVV